MLILAISSDYKKVEILLGHRLALEDIAKFLGCSRQTIRYWQTGRNNASDLRGKILDAMVQAVDGTNICSRTQAIVVVYEALKERGLYYGQLER